MTEHSMAVLQSWESFYVIVGSSAAALTGLQFVVIALIAESRMVSSMREISAFGTPTIVHFCAVLLIASILSAPWQLVSHVSAALAVCGFIGVGYMLIVIRRAKQQMQYKPVFEDWLWHAILPFISYVILLVTAFVLSRDSSMVLFFVGGVSLLLLFIGIHNAWDTVTYIAVERFGRRDSSTADKTEK